MDKSISNGTYLAILLASFIVPWEICGKQPVVAQNAAEIVQPEQKKEVLVSSDIQKEASSKKKDKEVVGKKETKKTEEGKKEKAPKAAQQEKVSKKEKEKKKESPVVDTRAVMTTIYQDKSGFGIPDVEVRKIEQKGGAPTYGEIKPESLAILLTDIVITPKDIFYDLGSGVGKVAMQAYLEFPFKKVLGIELSDKRHQLAFKARQELKELGLIDKKRTLEFLLDDIAAVDFSDATVIFMCSTCYSNELLAKLGAKFAKLKKGAHIISLKKIPALEHYGLELIREYRLPMTWSSPEGSPVYVYRRI